LVLKLSRRRLRKLLKKDNRLNSGGLRKLKRSVKSNKRKLDKAGSRKKSISYSKL